MPKGDYLGEFEVFVLAALRQLDEDAYGVTILREIESRTNRRVSLGSVYGTLARLEAKGYVRFHTSDPLPVRGGRARKFARLTPAGLYALERSASDLLEMLQGLRLRERPS